MATTRPRPQRPRLIVAQWDETDRVRIRCVALSSKARGKKQVEVDMYKDMRPSRRWMNAIVLQEIESMGETTAERKIVPKIEERQGLCTGPMDDQNRSRQGYSVQWQKKRIRGMQTDTQNSLNKGK